MRLIRHFGDPDPLADTEVVNRIVNLTFSEATAKAFIRFSEKQRRPAIPGKTVWFLTPEYGFSRSYQFGPFQFACWMEDADAARLLGNEWDRWSFADITDEPWRIERTPLTPAEWKALLLSFAKLTDQRGRPEQNPRDARRELRQNVVAGLATPMF